MMVQLLQPLRVANTVLALLIEFAALAALAWWGFAAGSNAIVHLVVGVGAALLAAVVWGLFAAPRARIRLPLAGVLAVKALVFGAATVGLYVLGHHTMAIAFAVIAAANTSVVTFDRHAWKPA